MHLALIIFVAALLGQRANAVNELPEFYRGVRAMGMGNAFTAVADDADAVFYNPAGIAMNTGFQLRLLNPKLEVSSDVRTLANEIRTLGGSGFNADAMNALFGKNIYGSGTVFPSIMVPNFTIGYFADFNLHAVINNKANPRIDLNYYYDQGVVGGTGFETRGFGKFHMFRFGLSTRVLTRRGVSTTVPISTIVSGGKIISKLTSDASLGVGVTPGVQYEFPSSPMNTVTLGMAWHDIGDTKFGTRLSNRNRAPPSIPSNLALGAAFTQRLSKRPGYNAKFSLEGRHMNRSGEDPRKKIHLGTEFQLGLLSLRAGLNQLRWTAGLGLDLWFVELAVASYAVESLPLWAQSTERRYALQLTFKLDASSDKDRSAAERERRKRPRLYR
jgi:hypothetical protein